MTPDAIVNVVFTLVGQLIIAAGILLVTQARRTQDKQALDAATKQTAAKLADTNVEAERLRTEAYDKQNRFFFEQYKELTTKIDDTNSALAAAKERAAVLDEVYQKDRAALVKSIADQQTQIDSLLAERDTLKKERDQAIETKNAAETKASALETQIAELRDQLAQANTAQTAKDAEFDRRIKQLETQMTSLTAERDQALTAAATATARAEAAEARAAELEAKYTDLEEKYRALQLMVTPAPIGVDPPIASAAPEVA